MGIALVYRGYRYLKHKETKFKTWWRCESYKDGCTGWLVEVDGVYYLTRIHNHLKRKEYEKIVI